MSGIITGTFNQGRHARAASMQPPHLLGQVIAVTGGISVEAFTDAPCPRVGVTVTGLNPSVASTITVWRSVPGEARASVRGARNLVVTAATFLVDYEAPLGRVVTYTLEVNGLTVPETLTATVTVPSDTVWMQDPLDPSTAVPVSWGTGNGDILFAPAALTAIGYPSPATLVRVMGATYPTALGGNRMGAASVPLDLLTRTIIAANQVRILLNAAEPLLVRTIPAVSPPLPALAYVHASATEQRAPFMGGTLTTWALVGDLVTAPTINLLVATWTYANVTALYDTYATAALSGRTYLQWMRDPRP